MSLSETPAGKYMYGIIRGEVPQQFAARGIGEWGDTVYTVQYADLAVVVSDSPVQEYDSSRRNMMAHTRVLEEVMRDFTVLPIRFGVVAPNTLAIQQQLLQRRASEISTLLNDLQQRVEMGLKAFWYEEVVFREVVEENVAIRNLRNSLMGRPAEETYYERIRLGELIEAALQQKREQDAAAIMEQLHPLAYKTQINPVITDRMVLNAAFLIDRKQEAAFDAAVQTLDAALGQRLMFKYVGPVPPYNFVNLTISWE